MSAVGFVCALEREARHFGVLRSGERWVRLHDGSLLACAGMGKERAADAARMLVDVGATSLVSWGLAGALDPTLAAGTIFLPVEVIDRRGGGVPVSLTWHATLARQLVQYRATCIGTILAAPRVLRTCAEKAGAFRETGARAVDMESGAVAEVASGLAVPFIVLRVIVDTAADSIPLAAIAAAGGASRIDVRTLLTCVVRAHELPALVRLGFRYRAARATLASMAQTPAIRAGLAPQRPAPARP
ncbi:MAG TPA: hypothetical protein VFS52_11665 [Steroidobacteraceae bacterium]|nr:hypothetical protein [Steroidobacteraceae bacterium]